MLDALGALGREARAARTEAETFRGLSRPEAEEKIRDLRTELDEQTKLALFASIEAVVMRAAENRIGWKGYKALQRKLRRLFGRKSRPTFGEVLEVLAKHLDGVEVHEFREVFGHRHSLAHGRHLKARAGVRTVDPEMVRHRGRRLLEALPQGA